MDQKLPRNDLYKIYQLMEFFTNKYNFSNVFVGEFLERDEVWLCNPTNKDFNMIRISIYTLDESYMAKDRLNKYISAMKRKFRVEPKFVDIHITKEIPSDIDSFNNTCIELDYYEGVELEPSFPGIKNVIHEVLDADQEIAYRIGSINDNLKEQAKQRKRNIKARLNLNATLIIEAICILFYIVNFFLAKKYDHTTALILTGADYKMFSLGMGQYFRLLTSGFNHSSLLHLLLNMYSFYYIGNYVEQKYGSLKMVIILLSSIIAGSLTFGIWNENTLSCGLSGGIYGLLFIYLMDAILIGAYRNSSFIIMLLLNLYLNFQPGVAWQCHLGGLICGVIFYYMFLNGEIDNRLIVLAILFFVVLIVKYLSTTTISPLYGGTDFSVVEAYRDLGFKSYADKLLSKLYNYYK